MNKTVKIIFLGVVVILIGLICPAEMLAFDTPTMGWSSWNTYRVNISDSIIRSQADALVELGLNDAGYEYINIDDGFFGGRDADGHLRIHPVRFPEGLKPVVDHIHELGLKAGIYSDAGMNTCGNYWDNDTSGIGVGFYGHDIEDARFYFDETGFDFIKVDFCGGDGNQNRDGLSLDERERYTDIRRAIDRLGRKDVRVNVCRWAFPGTWVHTVGTSWRISPDIYPAWKSIRSIINANKYLSAYAYGGHYNDMDMLEIGRGLSEAEERTHFGMWCMMSSPLLIGCDLRAIPEESLRLLTNPELIALNQDSLGLQAYIVETQPDGLTLWVKDVKNFNGTTRAMAITNESDADREYVLKPEVVDIGGPTRVRDLFERRELGEIAAGDNMSIIVGAHDTRIFQLEGKQRFQRQVYEAETAWLERYERLGKNPSMGYAEYADDSLCSGGGKVRWLGGHPENKLEWRNVYCEDGGTYDLTLEYIAKESGYIFLSVNNGPSIKIETPSSSQSSQTEIGAVTIRVDLTSGNNLISLSNPEAFTPEIDRMILRHHQKF